MAFLLHPKDPERIGLWRVIGIEWEGGDVRQGRSSYRGPNLFTDVMYQVLFEECEKPINLKPEVVWSMILDSWYFNEND